jgi:ATP-dependent DNA helicase DinG
MSETDELFASGGRLAGVIPGFTPRTAQQLMARAVEDAIATGEQLVVEAGTGTGKTFAYLVPALLSGARTIISTGTRALQDQLFHRDLPTVCEALGRRADAALLKGRSNYLCLHRLEQALTEHGALSRAERQALVRWRDSTESGDRAEVVAISEDAAVWPRVTSTTDNCLGQQCPMFEECYVARARRRAQAADLVVVNHHLLLADLAFREGGFVEFLPDADAIVLDEAHQVPDIATQFFGVTFSTLQLERLLDEVEVSARTTGGPPLLSALADLRRAAATLRHEAPRDTGRHEMAVQASRLQAPLEAMGQALAGLTAALDPLAGLSGTLDQLHERAVQIHDRFLVTSQADDTDGLRWLDVGNRGLRMHMTPLDVAGRLAAAMRAMDAAWLFTSATLAVGEDFSHFTERMGLAEPRCLRYESPYDLTRRARVFVPEDMPAPSDPGYTAALLDAVSPLLAATHGGVFFLHTSHRALRESADWFADRPALLGKRSLYVQGDAPRDKLLAAFRAEGDAVLLATGTFWEGVDVRGSALTLVVIDKLPFTSPGDPLLMARTAFLKQQGRNPFRDHQLPQAVLSLKQGVGRLLRDPDDYGVIAIGDPRLFGRSYGRTFLQALAPAPVIRDAGEAAAFLAGFESPPALRQGA